MEQKSPFMTGFMAKFAAAGWWQKVRHPVQTVREANKAYQAVANTPAFKAKKALGWSILGAGGAIAAGHKLMTPPKQQLTGPGAAGIPHEGED